jgi:hypothetical protein
MEDQLFESVSINSVDRYRSVNIKLSLIDLVEIRWNEPSDLMSIWPKSKEEDKKILKYKIKYNWINHKSNWLG